MSEVLLYARTAFDHDASMLDWWCQEARASRAVQGYLAHKKQPPPEDHHQALGTGLLLGPRVIFFLISEVPLYRAHLE